MTVNTVISIKLSCYQNHKQYHFIAQQILSKLKRLNVKGLFSTQPCHDCFISRPYIKLELITIYVTVYIM